MNSTIKTSRGPVRFHSVGKPIVGIDATEYFFNGDRTITQKGELVAKAFVGKEREAYVLVNKANAVPELVAALDSLEPGLLNLHCALQSTACMDPRDKRIAEVTGSVVRDLLVLRDQARAAIAKARKL